MKNLKEYGLIDVLNKKVLDDKTPILGICLGMQLFSEHSEEGETKGLGWIESDTVKFSFNDNSLRIPHIGWNKLSLKKESILFKDVPTDKRFYFVHSYYVNCKNEEDTVASTNYGIDFTSAIQKGNIYGTQFHPEKSHKHGLKIIDNFLRYP